MAYQSPRICVYGAGAIGGIIAARLIAGGRNVSLVARGETLDAIKRNGLKLLEPEGETVARPAAVVSNASELEPQDIILCCVKSHQVPDVVHEINELATPGASILFVLNGIPWWFFHGFGGQLEGTKLDIVDPGSRTWDAIGPDSTLGCVIGIAGTQVEPGVIRVNVAAGKRLVIGEPDGSISPRLESVKEALSVAGLEIEATPEIRSHLTRKLLGNVTYNGISALTRSSNYGILSDPLTGEIVRKIMLECVAVMAALGVTSLPNPDEDLPKQLQAMEARRPEDREFRTSTLQDLEKGRPLEIDALVGTVSELGRLAGVPTPTIDTTYALVRRLAMAEGLYPREKTLS